jgi:biotin operon repressor
MSVITTLERIKYIDYLIINKNACCLHSLSIKLRISKRQVLNTINLMKELGAPIEYSKQNRKYYYSENKKFNFGYS